MLTRTGTIVRKQRRRSSTTSKSSFRRESATTPTPSACPTPSPSPSFSACASDHGGQYLFEHHPPNSFPSPFPTPDPSPLSNGQVKGVTFSFDVRAITGHLAVSKVSINVSTKSWNIILLFLPIGIEWSIYVILFFVLFIRFSHIPLFLLIFFYFPRIRFRWLLCAWREFIHCRRPTFTLVLHKIDVFILFMHHFNDHFFIWYFHVIFRSSPFIQTRDWKRGHLGMSGKKAKDKQLWKTIAKAPCALGT